MALMNRGYNDPDYFANSFRPTVKAPVVAAPVAPAPSPPPVAAAPPPPQSLTDYDTYMAQQQAAFVPQFLRTAGGGGGDMPEPYYDIYSQYDPYAASTGYMQKLYSELGVAPELAGMYDKIYNYAGARESLARDIGFTGRQSIAGRPTGAVINESGDTSTAETATLSPEYARALTGYTFQPTIQGNDPAVDVFKPNGEKVGQYRIGDSPGSMMKFMGAVIPALVTGGFGAALAPLALSGLGIGASPLTSGIASKAIGSGLNTAVQGGGIEDVLKSAALSGATAGASNYINTDLVKGLNSALPKIDGSPFFSGVGNSISDTLVAAGLPGSAGEYASKLVPNVVQGAARGAITGDIGGGIASGVLGQIVNDVSPQLNLTPAQGRSLATYLMDGDEAKLVMSLGSGLAKQAIGAVGAIETKGDTFPGYDDINYGDYGGANDYGMFGDLPVEQQTVITGVNQFPGYDDILYGDYGGAYSGLGDLPANQQVVITGGKTSPPADDALASLPGYGGDLPPITLPALPQVIITGQKPLPADDELNLPPYDYSIPELQPLEPPKIEVEQPTAPPLPIPGSTTSTPTDTGLDLSALLNLLGGSGQQPVLSQALAQMPGFDVNKMSQFLQAYEPESAPDQQTQLAELFAALGYEG